MRTLPPTRHRRATTPWSATLLHAAAALAAAGINAGVATAADTSVLGIPGSWQLRETRAGNLCEARATFTADTPGALEGAGCLLQWIYADGSKDLSRQSTKSLRSAAKSW